MTGEIGWTIDFMEQLPPRGMLVFARLLPIVVFTPIFGGEAVPRRFRFGFTVFLAGVLTLALPGSGGPPPAGLILTGLIFKEILIGATLALFLRIMFETFRAAGAMSDVLRAMTIASVLDATSREQSSILGAFYFQLAIVLLVSVGGLGLVVTALADTFIAMPVFAPGPSYLVGPPTSTELLGLLGLLFVSALKIAAPVLAVILVTDLSLGLLNRAAPQIQVFFLGFTIKGWLGLFATLLAISFSVQLIYRIMAGELEHVSKWLG